MPRMPLLFYPMMAYERLVNSSGSLSLFRVNILGDISQTRFDPLHGLIIRCTACTAIAKIPCSPIQIAPTSAESTSIIADWRIRLIESTRRTRPFLRTSTPSIPANAPRVIRTLRPTVRYGCGSSAPRAPSHFAAPRFPRQDAAGRLSNPTRRTTPGVTKTRKRSSSGIRTKM